MASTYELSVRLKGAAVWETVVGAPEGPTRVFVDVVTRYKAAFWPPAPLDAPRLGQPPLEWTLLDPATGTEVPFPYRVQLQKARENAGFFHIQVTRSSLEAGFGELLQSLQLGPRTYVLSVRASDWPADDLFFRPAQLRIQLADMRIAAFPPSARVPRFSARSFGLDAPPPPRADRPAPRIRRVAWSADVPGFGVMSGPTHTVQGDAGSYPDFAWEEPWSTWQPRGTLDVFNRYGEYEIRCDVEFDAQPARSLRHRFTSVDWDDLPEEMAIVQLGALPALVGEPAQVRVQCRPSFCRNLPGRSDWLSNVVGVNYTWYWAETAGQPESAWITLSWHKFRELGPGQFEPGPDTTDTPPRSAKGSYAVRCDVVLEFPGPRDGEIGDVFTRTLMEPLTAVPREPVLRLLQASAERNPMSLETHSDMLLARARGLQDLHPGSSLARHAEEAHARLSQRIAKYYTHRRDPERPLSWKLILVEPLPAIYVPLERTHAFPLRLYWGIHGKGLALLDALSEEIRDAMGVVEEAVYTVGAEKDRSALVAEFISHNDYPRGFFYFPGGERFSTDTVGRWLVEGADKVFGWTGLAATALLLAPELGPSKVVGAVLGVGAGVYFAIRGGYHIKEEWWNRDTLGLTEAETWFDLVDVAGGMIGVTQGTVQLRSGFRFLRRGHSIRLLKAIGGEHVLPTGLTRTLAVANLTGDVAGIAVIGSEVAVQIEATLNDTSLSVEERNRRVVRTLGPLLAQGAVMMLSSLSALPGRKLWERGFWRPTLTQALLERRDWLARARALGVVTSPPVAGRRRAFYEMLRTIYPRLAVAFRSKQVQEVLGVFAHREYLQREFPGRYTDFVAVGGAGRMDVYYIDTHAPAGRRLVVCEVKATWAHRELTLASFEKVRRIRPARRGQRWRRRVEIAGTPGDFTLPVRTGSQVTVAESTLRSLRDRTAGVKSLDGRPQALDAVRAEIESLRSAGFAGDRYQRHYALVGPDARMDDALIPDFLRRTGGTLFVNETDATLAMRPELFAELLKAGHYQLLRITNVQLSRHAYLARGGTPDPDEEAIGDDQAARLKTLRDQLTDAIAEEFTKPDQVEALLDTVEGLDPAIRSGFLENALLGDYSAHEEGSLEE